MENLSYDLLKRCFAFPKELVLPQLQNLPEKVLQFGEGNFLRGFVDWMLEKMNSKGLFGGKAVVVQPIAQGLADMVNAQEGLYTLLLRGISEGKVVEEKSIISSISRCINPYSNFDQYLKCAENPDLRFIISNTTEAGIAYNASDRPDDAPPSSFPGKLTVLLYKRYKAFGGDFTKGFVIIPCELIDRNGDNLKKIVLQLSKEWGYEESFISWVKECNFFLNTLVDRIVTGYPREEVPALTQELGYRDNLLNTAEIFHLWVIEGDEKFSRELPLTQAGINVIWTNDMSPYRTRKVRILNGAHTMTVPAAYLYGKDTVKECMDDEVISRYMKKGIIEEVIPTLDLPYSELESFANSVCERFENPFIKHYLLSISLNSVSKFKTRVLPSITEYAKRKGKLPAVLTFSLAALIAFYRGTEIKENALIGSREGAEYRIIDDAHILEFFKDLWSGCQGSREELKDIVANVLARQDFWGEDLNDLHGLTAAVEENLFNIASQGIKSAIKNVL